MNKTVARVLVDTLAAHGIRHVHGVPGDSLNGITDAIRERGDIRWLLFRHEEAVAFAAGAEAHLTGELAVCVGSCGPGNVHLINGLYDCQRTRVPVLAIAAQVPTSEIGSGYFQETHPERLFTECSVYCEVVSQPEQMPRTLEIAIRTAVARRGVAVIVLPGDVALSRAVFDAAPASVQPSGSSLRPADEVLDDAARMLQRAKRVTILAGAGCAGAHDELIDFADRVKAPIVHAFRGKEFVEYDNPFDVGMTGLIGFSSGCHAMKACDVLVMLGTHLPYPQFFPKHANVIQVDLRGEQIGRRTRVDVALNGDVKTTLLALLARLETKTDRAHLDTAREHYRTARRGLDELATGSIPPGAVSSVGPSADGGRKGSRRCVTRATACRSATRAGAIRRCCEDERSKSPRQRMHSRAPSAAAKAELSWSPRYWKDGERCDRERSSSSTTCNGRIGSRSRACGSCRPALAARPSSGQWRRVDRRAPGSSLTRAIAREDYSARATRNQGDRGDRVRPAWHAAERLSRS